MKQPDPKQAGFPHPSLKHPGRWLWLLLLVPIVLGLTRLRFDVEVFDLLPSTLPPVEGLKLYQKYFANARELLITVQATEPEQAENAARKIAEQLRPQTNLVAAVTWEPPWLERPEQAAELLAYLWFNQPPAVFAELTNRLAADKLSALLTAAREQLATSLSPEEIARLSYDPFGLTRLPETAAASAPAFGQGQEMFTSKDGTFRLLFVQARNELRTYRDCKRWLDAIKPLATNAAADLPRISLGYTGRPAFVAEVASGMEHDTTASVGGTAGIIAILFWLAHRRIKPMLWLLALLAIILGCTLALGGLIFGTINVISMGFAAILLGLAVDYAVVHYQEALAQPDLTIPQIRHAIAPSILWAAVTTIAAFLVLNFGGLPGLAQLGTLVGLGVGLAASIMIFEFLPPLFPGRIEPKPKGAESNEQNVAVDQGEGAQAPARTDSAVQPPIVARAPVSPRRVRTVLAITGLVVAGTFLVLAFGLPPIDPTANALRPRKSPAYAAMDEIQARLSQTREPLWLIVGGASVSEVAERLEQVQTILRHAVSNSLIAGFTLPAPLWPHPQFQAGNRASARQLSGECQLLRQTALSNGFAESSLVLTEAMLSTWEIANRTSGIFWPTNPSSQWIFEKFAAHTPTNDLALGLVNALTNSPRLDQARLAALQAELPAQDAWLSGWELLGRAVFERVKANMWKVVAPMILLVLLSLYLAFRRLPEILLSLAVLTLSGLCLLTLMRLFGWSWNLLNLMAVPLVLGTGVDYSIFMQLALRRHHGNPDMAHQAVGRALLLCGGTAMAGFGSLGLSSNVGMASLGQVCAVGIGSNMLIAIFLLPIWWTKVKNRNRNSKGQVENPSPAPVQKRHSANPGPLPCADNESSIEDARQTAVEPEAPPSTPSAVYRSEFWLMGLWLVRVLPRGACVVIGRTFARLAWAFARRRRDVVIGNLLPAVSGDRAAASRTAKALFQQFALKLVDLWRFEAGLPIDDLFGSTSGWERFEQARQEKRGVLLLTPHLGNWEFGGAFLNRSGVALQVITLAEPGQKFTELRQASRARWNIGTLVIGDNPLAFVEIIHRLETGATVALLIDRPPAASAVTVDLFGRPFGASVAAAELARASGCALLPVYIPRRGNVYEAHILSPISYDRAALRERAARQELTQRIMNVFESVLRQNLDQWYHFVPIWPNTRR